MKARMLFPFFVMLLLPALALAQSPQAVVDVPKEVHLKPSQTLHVMVGFDPSPFQNMYLGGYGLGFCYDPAIVQIRILERAHALCVGCEPRRLIISEYKTGLTVAEWLSFAPSSGLLSSGLPDLLEMEITPLQKGTTVLRMCNNLGSPPVLSTLVFDGDGVTVPEQDVLTLIIGNPAPFLRGDANSDGTMNIADASFILSYLFAHGPTPRCLDAADTNDDGQVNISDPVFLLRYLFSSGPAMPEPFPDIGEDPTLDSLPCAG